MNRNRIADEYYYNYDYANANAGLSLRFALDARLPNLLSSRLDLRFSPSQIAL